MKIYFIKKIGKNIIASLCAGAATLAFSPIIQSLDHIKTIYLVRIVILFFFVYLTGLDIYKHFYKE